MTKLRERRLEKGMTQEQLARACAIKRTRLANYEKGIREPNIRMLRALSSALDCTVDELIGPEPAEAES
ncbi:MAG: helix-turn-helix transcriptional regulator [Clostridia bacterium]|nr:helix-turn-helix transcriptional regulator [Clostridia bacterium]